MAVSSATRTTTSAASSSSPASTGSPASAGSPASSGQNTGINNVQPGAGGQPGTQGSGQAGAGAGGSLSTGSSSVDAHTAGDLHAAGADIPNAHDYAAGPVSYTDNAWGHSAQALAGAGADPSRATPRATQEANLWALDMQNDPKQADNLGHYMAALTPAQQASTQFFLDNHRTNNSADPQVQTDAFLSNAALPDVAQHSEGAAAAVRLMMYNGDALGKQAPTEDDMTAAALWCQGQANGGDAGRDNLNRFYQNLGDAADAHTFQQFTDDPQNRGKPVTDSGVQDRAAQVLGLGPQVGDEPRYVPDNLGQAGKAAAGSKVGQPMSKDDIVNIATSLAGVVPLGGVAAGASRLAGLAGRFGSAAAAVDSSAARGAGTGLSRAGGGGNGNAVQGAGHEGGEGNFQAGACMSAPRAAGEPGTATGAAAGRSAAQGVLTDGKGGGNVVNTSVHPEMTTGLTAAQKDAQDQFMKTLVNEAQGQSSGPPKDFYVYTGGNSDGYKQQLQASIGQALGDSTKVHLIDDAGKWAEAGARDPSRSVLMVSGGSVSEKWDGTLTHGAYGWDNDGGVEDQAAKVRQAVHDGAGYLGICAGAYLGSRSANAAPVPATGSAARLASDNRSYLGLSPDSALGWANNDASVMDGSRQVHLVHADGSTSTQPLYNGPLLGARPNDGSRILASFNDPSIAQPNFATTDMKSAAATSYTPKRN